MSQPLKRKYVRKAVDVADLEVDMKRLAIDWRPDFETPLTLGQEVLWALYEYYTERGASVPVEERGCGAVIDAELKKEYDGLLSEELYALCYGKKHPAPPKTPPTTSAAGEKPEFGTPVFWAWARRRKIEKLKEAEVKAAEKDAAKKAKDEAKAAAAAEKAAKKAAKKK